MNLFWELRQQLQINQAQHVAADARSSAERARHEIARLRQQCEASLLICETLWTLLRDKLDLTDDEFLERLTQIDMTDGKLDRQVRHPPADCPACQRTNPRRLARCMYCGEELQRDPFAS